METENKEVYHTVVIGAGVMGSATAYYLSKFHGKKVLLLEQFDFLHRRGSSHGDSRITRLTYPEDHYTFLMFHSRILWQQAEEESGMKVYTKTGGLDFGDVDNKRIHAIIDACKKHSVPHKVLDSGEISALFPTLKVPDSYIGVYSPDSGVLNATKAVSMFQLLARLNGAKLVDNAPVNEIVYTPEANGTVQLFEIKTEQGTFKAENCVVTAGAWTQKVVQLIKLPDPKINLRLPLCPVQTTVVYWSVKDNAEAYAGRGGKMPVFIDYQVDVYGLPAVEFPTLIKVQTHYGDPVDPDRRDFLPPDEVTKTLVPYIKSHLPGVTAEPVRSESCMYTMSPDGDFIVDKVEKVPGLFVGCGFSGHGFKLSPVVGKILADMVATGVNPYHEVAEHLSIKRFK